MKTHHYFPQNEVDRIRWLSNYANALTKYGTILGLSSDEITGTQKDIYSYIWHSQNWYPPIQQFARDTTAYRDRLAYGDGAAPEATPTFPVFTNPPAPCLPGLFNRIFNQVQRIKLHPTYTNGIGQDLGCIAGPSTIEQASPVFTATLEQGVGGYQVRLDYKKQGHAGVAIEYCVNAGPWQLLGHFTQKTAYDDHSLAVPDTAETREYRMRWWDKDEAHGNWSAVQAVFVGN